MNVLTSREQAWNDACGLPAKYLLTKIVLDYARGASSLAEYSEYYSRMDVAQKQFCDDMVAEISVATKKEMI